MPEISLPMPRPHAGQREVLRSKARFLVLCCGRRWGKNVVAHRRVVKNSRGPVAWYAPTYRMLSEDWRELSNRLAPITTRRDASEHRLELLGGGSVDMWSLDNPDSSRGRKYQHVIINEAAMVKGLGDAWNMVIRPTLADLRGSADFLSTPKGLNDFHGFWRMAGDDPDWTRFHYTTDDNPHIPRDEIAAMRASLPERVIRQEIDAEFVEDGSFFQGVDSVATIIQPDDPEKHSRHHLVMGVDWALSQDFTVLTVACRDCNRVVDWQRFNQIDYTYQRAKVIEMARRWRITGALPERNSIGQPNIELLMQAGVPVFPGHDELPGFSTTATTKPQLIQALALALEHGGFLVPADYADELRSYEVETMASGHPRFSAPDGYHDDRVISLALAWWAMQTMAGPIPTGQPVQQSKWIDTEITDGASRWRM